MEKQRCSWCLKDDLYKNYHDTEWGIPVHDDNTLFEYLVLESFQAGLSWYTILAKRENFRKALDGFDAKIVQNYDEVKIESLMQDAGIIRNRAKILATINNAKQFLRLQKEHGSFDTYIWQFTNHKTILNSLKTNADIVATTKESDLMAKTIKKEGFKFLGSTTCYAFMQAIGMVDDHLDYCWRK